MPHVLHVIEYLDKGGATRAALSTAKQSAKIGPYEHSIVSLKPAHPAAIELAKEAKVHVHETPSLVELDGLIDDADIVQVEYWNAPAVNHFLHTSFPPSRLAIWFHIAGTSSPQRIHDRLFNFADIPIACAPTPFQEHPIFKNALDANRIPEPGLVTAPADFDRLRKLEKVPHEGFNIGYIGTLSFVKLHKDFIPMSVNIEIPNSTFIVCGEGNEELKKQAAAMNGLDRFDFRGFVEDIRSVLEVLDVYGYPLCEDTYAAAELNLQEVMYAGIPPIVFPHGGIKGLIQHNRTGLFVTNMEDYRRAIEYLYYNPVERKRLGVNAAAYARAHFGAKNAARSMNKVYDKLMALPKRYHTWGEEPQNFAPKLSKKKSGQKPTSDIFMESMGISENPFLISKHESDTLKQLEADQQISQSSFQVFNSGIYRYLLHTPEDPYMNLWAGLYLEENGNIAEALSTYASAISAGLSDWRVQWYLGRTLKKLGKLEEAHRVYTSLRQNVPDFEVITQDSSFASHATDVVNFSKEPTPLLDIPSNDTSHEHNIRVSAIVSTYNAESFMEGCMENLVNQSLFKQGELEIVVIDACSEENEKEIVKRFQSENDNITYIRTDERETLYASWNRGIQVARGTYITSANTDDRHKHDALEKLANYLDDYPEIALTYPGQIDTSVPNETFETTSSEKVLDWPVYTYEELEHHCIIGSQPIWRRSLHEKHGLFRDTFKSAGDYEFWLRVGKEEKFFRYPEVLGLYYRNPKGIEHSSDTSKREALEIWEEYGMFERGIPVILNGRVITSPEQVFPQTPSLQQAQLAHEGSTHPEALPFDAYINQFEEQLIGSKFQGALDIAERAVRKYPDLPYAHILKAIALRQLHDFSNAIVSLEESIKIEETPEALVELVQLSLSTANLEEAYRTEIYIKENYPEWGQRLNGLNIPEPQAELSTEETEPNTEEVVTSTKNTLSALAEGHEVNDIIELISTESSEEHITLQLNSSSQSNPMSLPASIEDLDYTVKSFDELRDEFEKLIKLRDVQHAEELALAATRRFPDNSEAWILKATSYRLKGSFEEAKEAIQQSLLIKDTPEALIELLELSISTGNDLEALHISEAIKSSYPEYRDYITQLLEKKTSLKTRKATSLHPAIYNFAPIDRESKIRLNSDDICIVSFPGSGSAWLSTLLSDVLQQSKGYSTKQAKLAIPPAEIVKDLHQAFDVSQWLTDHSYDFKLFKTFDIAGVTTQKIIYVFGDPIASLISAYHSAKQISYLKHLSSTSCDSFCLANIDNYNMHLNTALILKEANPDRVMLFNSKDMTGSQLSPLKELHNFIGIPFNSSITLQALKNCDTENYLSEKTKDIPVSFSSLDYLQPGNEISRLTLEAILSRLMPVYQEACKMSDQNTRVTEQPPTQERLTLSIPI